MSLSTSSENGGDVLTCPECGANVVVKHGMVGGVVGAYRVCTSCTFFDKTYVVPASDAVWEVSPRIDPQMNWFNLFLATWCFFCLVSFMSLLVAWVSFFFRR